MGADCLAVFTGCLGTVPGVGFLKVVAWVLPSVLSVGSGRRSLGVANSPTPGIRQGIYRTELYRSGPCRVAPI